MKLARRRRGGMRAMNMTPMIDIVFLLLIFFMTVTQVSEINKERLDLPRVGQEAEQQGQATITINVDRAGALVVSGYRYGSVAQLIAMVSDEIALAGQDPGRLRIVLRADRGGQSRTVNEVVAALAEMGVYRVRLAVVREG